MPQTIGCYDSCTFFTFSSTLPCLTSGAIVSVAGQVLQKSASQINSSELGNIRLDLQFKAKVLEL
jgi:hypothetical protein